MIIDIARISVYNIPPMNQLREMIHPGLRGALFYAMYWGVVGMYEPFLTLFFLKQGINANQIGWLAAILPLCTMVVTPLVSRLADHLHRRVAILALAGLGFGAALTIPAQPAFQPTFSALAFFVALFSVFRSPMIALGDSLIAQMAVRHALDFGSMRLWGSIVFTFTAIGLGLVWERAGFATMFLSAGLGFLLVITAALLLDEAPRIAHPTEEVKRTSKGARPSIDAGLLFLLGATFLVVAALFMAGTFGAVYMNQLGGSQMMVGALMGVGAMGEVPGMMYGGRVARRIGVTNTLLLAYTAIAVGLAVAGLVRQPWLLLVLAMLRGLGFGLMLVGTVMTINTRAPSGYTSTFQGILNAACWGLAPLLGGPISGWIYQAHGPAPLFFTAGVMGLAACVLIAPTYRLWKGEETAT